MKTIHSIYMIAVLASASFAGAAQDYPDEYLGLPGDNLNLYAVMNLFQESETLEGFERSLNDNEAVINNLDLNGDQLIDYIAVSDFKKENVHTIVLRTALNRNEEQDIAVFVVEKLRNGAVQIQLIGDEALYGRNYIVEPIYAETPNPGYNGTIHSRNANVVNTSSYDIGAWPVVRYIYAPRYRVWRSSWYWGYYPTYWRPWRPHYWHYYYGYHNQWHNHYYSHYRHWDHYRCRKYKTYYHSHVRVHSPTVVVNINQNRYRSTYSRPDQRRAGEKYYTSSASRSNRSSTVQRSQPSQNRSAVQRSSSSRSSSTRSNSTRSTPAVKRSSSNKSTPAVQPKSSSRSSSSRSTPAVKRSTSTRKSSSAVKRSNGSTNSRSSSVQRSQSGKSKSKSS
ncbi:MAG: hypothetical protein GY790_00510, partial [Bacteroidetes bacterium]|nr:hypothetical protein [Bacteroidota bacterium]